MSLLEYIIYYGVTIIGFIALFLVMLAGSTGRVIRPKGSVGPKPRPNNKRVATKPEREE